MADDAGALLVRSGLVSSNALEQARARSAEVGGTIGEQLVAAGDLTDEALTEFYRTRLLVPQVNPNTLARLPAKVIAMLPPDLAIELRAIPVALDGDQNLTVAMSDPSDRQAVDEIAFMTHAYVVRAVATQMQLAWCLAHYYGHVTVLGQRLLRSEDGAPPPQPSPRPSRPRGMTSKIAAARHRTMAPVAPDDAAPTAPAVPDDAVPAAPAVPDDAAPEPIQVARTASGEIRAPKQRAASIKPPLPEESSGPVITIEVEDSTDEVPPRPKRVRPAKTDPPELAARAGEVVERTGKVHSIDDGPRVVISEELAQPDATGEIIVSRRPRTDGGVRDTVDLAAELSEPVMIYDAGLAEDAAPAEALHAAPSQPILLERRRTEGSDPPPHGDDGVVMLEPKRVGARRRGDRSTQLGIGALPAATRPPTGPRAHRDTEADGIPGDADGVPGELDDMPTTSQRAIDNDPTRVDAFAAPAGDATASDDVLAAPPGPIDDHGPDAPPPGPSAAVPPPSGRVVLDHVRRAPTRDDDDDEDDGGVPGLPTQVMTAIEIDEAVEAPRAARTLDEIDDGWGPPGSTIPPPLLGAMPGTAEPDGDIIPMPNIDSAPLMITPPAAPEVGRAATDSGLARALEDATARILELLRLLEQAQDRDEVIAGMIAHLGESHRRAGFFAVRGGELQLFAMTPRPSTLPYAALRLDRPSTLQDVVGTHLPYRGPMVDDASRTFLVAALGTCPPEILLVPVTLRERVVGVLFGEHRLRHTFDDQLALAARAAGMALERILKARRV